jgi:predicted ATP-dependent endonuclease of OLD family
MNIKKIIIKNFRSIKELEFEPQSLCALIGGNNVGKSNILDALNLLLGETWPSIRNITDEDIYNKDISKDIEITIIFNEKIIEEKDAVDQDYYVQGIYLKYTHYKRNTKTKSKGEPKIDFYATDENGNIVLIIKQLRKSVKPHKEPINVNTEIREFIPVVHIGVNRDLRYQLSGTRWTLFGKLLQQIETDFKQDPNNIRLFSEKVEEISSLLKIQQFQDLEKAIKNNVIKQTGFKSVDINFSEHSIIEYYKKLSLYVKESNDYDEFNALDMGSGIQSAIVIGLINAYRDIKKSGSILLIEEPEVYLHPHSRRYFYSLIKDLTSAGNQIFYSTHSTEFVRLEDYKSICIVSKSPLDGTKIKQAYNLTLAQNEQEELKLLTDFDLERSELFFANRILLVEGNTERYSLPYIFKLLNTDINEAGISIVTANSKENLIFFIKILKAFDLVFVVLHDEDRNANNYNTNHIPLNSEIKNEVGDHTRVFSMDPDFEGLFNLQYGKHKPLRAMKLVSKITNLSHVPQIIQDSVNKLLSI